jgi:predicted RNase H-like HicB family nuclease
MRELVFNVEREEDGGFSAKSVGEGIYTQGDTWDELREMVLDATKLYFEDRPTEYPTTIRLHLEHVIFMGHASLAAA